MSITEKSWGTTEEILRSPLVEIHRIRVNPHRCCSMHYHARKWNAFAVISGLLMVESEGGSGAITKTVLRPGDVTTVRPGEYHRFVTALAPVIALELYYPDTLSEDIVRRDCGGMVKVEWSGADRRILEAISE